MTHEAVDNDDAMNTDYDMDTDLDVNKMPKCRTCGRFTYGHTHPYGPRCTMKRKRDEEIEEENKETLEKRRKMMKEKDQSVVIEQEETLPIPDPETAGGMDPNTANIFQQLLMQQNQMQQQNQTFMTQMFQTLSGSGGMNPPADHGYELPVPEWNQDMSFEAWKRKIFNFKSQSSMNENQKLILILESLKKNNEREELKDWIIQEIDEDITFDMTHDDAISKLIEKMEGKFEVSKWKKTGEIWEELIKFQIKEDETPKQYLRRFKQLESKIKNARTTISPQYLAHHFLLRANLDHLTIRSILAMANLESEEEVLKHIQKKYEDLSLIHI